MKLSIVIFVLATIIYGCQCAPNPDWLDDLRQEREAERQQRAEDQKQLNEHSEAERQQREQTRAETTENLNDSNINIVSGYSKISFSRTVNGNRVDIAIVQNVIDNVKYRTEFEYSSATDQTEIQRYECSPPSSPCILKITELGKGPPENFY